MKRSEHMYLENVKIKRMLAVKNAKMVVQKGNVNQWLLSYIPESIHMYIFLIFNFQ